MQSRILTGVISLAICAAAHSAFAEIKTVDQIGTDAEALSETMVAVPRHIADTADQEGPIIGITKGTLQGVGEVAESTADALVVQEDREGDAPLIRYHF